MLNTDPGFYRTPKSLMESSNSGGVPTLPDVFRWEYVPSAERSLNTIHPTDALTYIEHLRKSTVKKLKKTAPPEKSRVVLSEVYKQFINKQNDRMFVVNTAMQEIDVKIRKQLLPLLYMDLPKAAHKHLTEFLENIGGLFVHVRATAEYAPNLMYGVLTKIRRGRYELDQTRQFASIPVVSFENQLDNLNGRYRDPLERPYDAAIRMDRNLHDNIHTDERESSAAMGLVKATHSRLACYADMLKDRLSGLTSEDLLAAGTPGVREMMLMGSINSLFDVVYGTRDNERLQRIISNADLNDTFNLIDDGLLYIVDVVNRMADLIGDQPISKDDECELPKTMHWLVTRTSVFDNLAQLIAHLKDLAPKGTITTPDGRKVDSAIEVLSEDGTSGDRPHKSIHVRDTDSGEDVGSMQALLQKWAADLCCPEAPYPDNDANVPGTGSSPKHIIFDSCMAPKGD